MSVVYGHIIIAMEDLVGEIRQALSTARAKGLTDDELQHILLEKGYRATSTTDKKTDRVISINSKQTSCKNRSCCLLNCFIFNFLPVLFILPILIYLVVSMWNGSACLLSHLTPFGEVVIPGSCDMCKGISHAPRLKNLSKEDFVRHYAYTGRPILVEGGASNWSALQVFSYDYLKSLYHSFPETLDSGNFQGQFFSYNSNIKDLNELFNLPDEVASLQQGERWYIGWSCGEDRIGKALQQHVLVPDFIPASLSDLSFSWIFMGSPGPGANLHIDVVDLPSWQAQLRGKKTWRLVPPPECEHVCQEFNVTMNTGDIIVVDTNKWFHETYIHPGSISITIGTEYM